MRKGYNKKRLKQIANCLMCNMIYAPFFYALIFFKILCYNYSCLRGSIMNIFKKKEKNILTRIFRKKSKLEKFYLKNEEFIKYSFVSTVCTGILFLIFFLVDLITKGNYLLANFLSYTISFTVLFIWDRKVFKSKPKRRRDKLAQLTSFIIIRVIGFPLDSLVLSVLINKFHIANMYSLFYENTSLMSHKFIQKCQQ